jgi:hypothetical protein
MVEIKCSKESAMPAKRKLRDFVRNIAIGIPVNDRHLIPLGPAIREIVSVFSKSNIPVIDNTRILHLHRSWRLEIYVHSSKNCLKECLEL